MVVDRHHQRILKRAIGGDGEAFISLCNRYSEALYRYLYFRLGSVFAAEEVTAQVLVRAWELLPSDPRLSTLSFGNWLFQIANEVVEQRNERFSRLGLHTPRPPLVAWTDKGGGSGGSLLHPRFLAQAAMQLEPVAQQVLLLRFVLRLPHRDVAIIVGDTNTGSRVLQYRAILELREVLTRKRMSENAYASDHVGTATFCLDRIISGRWDAQKCLEHLPDENRNLRLVLEFAELVREATNIRARQDFNDELKKQLRTDLRQSKRRPNRQPRPLRWFRTTSQRFPVPLLASFLLGLILLGTLTAATGVSQAVDRSLPGDRLYELDLRLERTYRAFLSSPDSRLEFALALTDERLEEAERLARNGDSSRLQIALVAYSIEVSALALESVRHPAPDNRAIDTHFATQQQRLDKLLVNALDTSSLARQRPTPLVVCESAAGTQEETERLHPVGLTLAAQHQVDYQDIMSWVCAGHSFGEIVLALASVDAGIAPAGDIIALKSQLGGWGQLWDKLATDPVDGEGFPTPLPTSTEMPETATATPLPEPNQENDTSATPAPRGTSTSGEDDQSAPPDVAPPDNAGPPDWVDPPGQGDNPPGQGNDPGNSGGGPPDWVNPPGHNENPGNSGNNRGNDGNPPGQDNNPGNGGNPPGQDNNPGNNGNPGNGRP